MTKKIKNNKTSAKDFELFQQECEYWLDVFSLREWRVIYGHKDISDAFAWMCSWGESRTCNINLCVKWEDMEVTDLDVCRSAFHEVCELLLSDMKDIARIDACPSDQSDLEMYNHSVIRRLENAVWLRSWNNRNSR